MKKVIREPLVHFLLLGAVLFGVYFALNRGNTAPPGEIVVTSGQIETLAVGFTRVWQRPPTNAELKGLIDEYIKEEVLCREAIKLGLDQNDSVVRRRLQQKMDFVAEDFVDTGEPTNAELADHLAKHRGQFAQEQRFTFRHVFLSREKRGDKLHAVAAALLARLKQNPAADISELGDPLLLPQEFTSEAQRDVAAQLGPQFAAEITKLKAGDWSGPILSSYGVHLVLVTQRTEARLPALDEVRDQVKRELINTRRAEANRRFLESLFAKYRVTIQKPPSQSVATAERMAINR